MTARDLGRHAQRRGVGAPTLDASMLRWLEQHPMLPRAEQMALWWAGWYQGLNERISAAGPNASHRDNNRT